MANPPGARHVALLLHEDVSISIALLMRDILQRANQLAGRERFLVALVGRPGRRTLRDGPVAVQVSGISGLTGPIDHLLVPPLAPGRDPFAARPGECRLVQRAFRDGATVHSACLGSLMVAGTGLLDGLDATTHWAWVRQARDRFPAVRWDASRMLCDAGRIVTSGGFLAAVDLVLTLVERTCSRAASRELGRLLLADSIRQHQSVYATTLVSARIDDPRMQRLEGWIDEHLASTITVDQMASVCRLSPRTFHRVFVKAFGCPPTKLLQRKRVERVRRLLRNPEISIEQAIASVGISDVPSFRKVFQRELGLSPAEYRRRLSPE